MAGFLGRGFNSRRLHQTFSAQTAGPRQQDLTDRVRVRPKQRRHPAKRVILPLMISGPSLVPKRPNRIQVGCSKRGYQTGQKSYAGQDERYRH